MLVAININNTRTGIGFFNEYGNLLESFYAGTPELVDFAADIMARITHADRIVAASVVPSMTLTFAACLARQGYRLEEVRVQEGLGVTFGAINYLELGADLFVNALALRNVWGRDSLTVDLGTGSTFCVVKGGVYLGTAIVPGMELSLRALTDRAALLDTIELKKPQRIINTTTISCLQAGIYYGYTDLVRGMIARIQKEQGKLFVVLTGGIGSFLQEELADVVDVFEPNLSLIGIKIAAEKVDCFPVVSCKMQGATHI